MDRLLKKCRIKSSLVRECLAEFFGVYIIILFGCGSVAQVTTSQNTKGDYLSINLGFALGTVFGIYVAKGVSGAFLAAATVALQYHDAIMHFSGGQLTVDGVTGTAGIFSTYPADYLSLWGGVVDQIIGTASLLVCVLALGDPHNTPAPPGLEPVLVGAVVMAIGVSMGSNCGYAINPARDFGPRLFSYIAGWGNDVFRAGHGWWWVPLVATCIGGLLGSLLYEFLIGAHHPNTDLTDTEHQTTHTLELGGTVLDIDTVINSKMENPSM